MENVKAVIRKYWKVYAAAVVLALVCDSVGTIKINIGIGTLTLFPMVFAVILGGLLGPDVIRMFNQGECKMGGSLVLVALAPFMAKMGVSAGANLAKLVAVGPALLLQEFGNLGTIFISLPIALLLGLKKEAIGACYSINRDSNLGLTTDIYGPDAKETEGTFAVYIVGSVIGTVFVSLLAGVVASWNIFHPLARGGQRFHDDRGGRDPGGNLSFLCRRHHGNGRRQRHAYRNYRYLHGNLCRTACYQEAVRVAGTENRP